MAFLIFFLHKILININIFSIIIFKILRLCFDYCVRINLLIFMKYNYLSIFINNTDNMIIFLIFNKFLILINTNSISTRMT